MPRHWQARASGSSYFGTSARRPASARIPARIAVMPTLLIADDHPLFRAALRQAAADAVDALQVREADSLESVLAALDAEPGIDLVLLDLHMPGNHGLAGLAAIRRSEEHTSELPSLMRLSYALFCL